MKSLKKLYCKIVFGDAVDVHARNIGMEESNLRVITVEICVES